MDYVYIGELVNTHGIKGEVRIISDFELKEQVFKPEVKLYIGKNKEEEVVKSYRHHKIFDMIVFEGLDNINDVLGYKGEKVYANRADLTTDKNLKQDLIGLEVYANDRLIGTVKEILISKAHDILVIKTDGKNRMVPLVDEFIKSVDMENKKIEVNEIKGLFDED